MSGVVPPATPPAPAAPPPTAPYGTPSVSGDISRATQQIPQLATGTIIKGEVIGQNPKGETVIQTPQGTVDVVLKTPLPVGTKVSLELQMVASQLRALILSVEQPKTKSVRDLTTPKGAKSATPATPEVTVKTTTPLSQPQTTERAKTPAAKEPAPPPPKATLESGITIKARVSTMQAELNPTGSTGKYAPPPSFKGVMSTNKGAVAPQNLSQMLREVTPPKTPAAPAPPQPSPLASAPSQGQPPPVEGTPLPPPASPTAAAPSPAKPVAFKEPTVPHAPSFSADSLNIFQAANPRPAISPSAGSTPVTEAAKPALLTEGKLLNVRVISITPSQNGQTIPTPPPNPATPHRFVANVVGANPRGQVLVQTANTLFVLPDVATTLPVGSQLVLEEASFTPPTPQGQPLPPRAPYLSIWPGLEDVLTNLQTISPDLAQAAAKPLLPQPGPTMPATTLFLLSAIFGGSIDGLINQNIQKTLQKSGFQASLDALESDLQSLRHLATPDRLPPTLEKPGDWRGLHIPIYNGAAQEQWNLYYRKEKQADADSEEHTYTRMVIDLDLTRLGPMQLDALFSPARFDLTLRSQSALPHHAHNELTQLFTSFSEASGFAGNLKLIVGAPFQVNIEESVASDLG